MLPKYHILLNLIISIILYFIFPLPYVLIFFFSSFLIDVDHYLYYIAEEKDFSLKKAYKWWLVKKVKLLSSSLEERKKHQRFILIFHGLEPIIILLLLSKLYYPLFFLSFGFLAHLVEDLNEAIALGVFRKKLFLSYSIYTHFK